MPPLSPSLVMTVAQELRQSCTGKNGRFNYASKGSLGAHNSSEGVMTYILQ
jgi:hypothetical protein